MLFVGNPQARESCLSINHWNIPADLRRQVGRQLLRWFRRHHRDLPWRVTRDPYAIWVSEVMLQQTQVATVVPYFLRFLTAFPTIDALAAAGEEEVLRLWEGLGYYRRARDLHRGARRLAAEHEGQLPDDPEVFRQLPGVGRYTLGAVLSQAFDRRLPILEANSQRVLCRLLGIQEDPRRGPVQKQLWEAAERLLPARHAGEFNQALMELGALVCTPAAPRCPACPLRSRCVARRLGLEQEIPRRPQAPTVTQVEEVAVVVWRRGRVLLARRPDVGRWAGLWEFPHGALEAGETHEAAASRVLRQHAGIEAELGAELLTIRHGVTRFRITLVGLEARHLSGEFRSTFYQQGRWLRPAQLRAYPVSVPQRRLAGALVSTRQSRLF
jgi:A/G-specific adenine glycosylase